MSEKYLNVQGIWNWLPAFRAVAETEHLPSASEMVHVTKPALSRTVRKLEEAVGEQLFNRSGRSMRLNETGARLLRAVRQSMRRVDDALQDIDGTTFEGPLTWTCNWSLSAVVLRGLELLIDDHSGVVPHMIPFTSANSTSMLLQGELDVTFVTSSMQHDGLQTTLLGPAPHSIYCGHTHDLWQRDQIGWDELEGRRFAAPLPRPTGELVDGWPPDRHRKVVMHFAQMSVGVQSCRNHGLLAVLPETVGEREEDLWRLKHLHDDHHAFAVHRDTLGRPGLVEELCDHVATLL